jgi:hypothetical protein
VQAEQDTHERVTRLWQWLTMEETLLNSRINFFLLTEAMMLAAFAALLTKSSDRAVVVMMGIVGAATSLLWAYCALVQRRLTVQPIHERLRALDADFREIAAVRDAARWRVPVNMLTGLVFPLLLSGVWVALIFLA